MHLLFVGLKLNIYISVVPHTDTYIYVPSVKNQYKRDVFGYMVIYITAICVSLLKISTR